ncbi:TIGR03118 family protein [Streptomyces sp. NPDC005811]|uniref:TIGR03118 family protein n=1 Tax=Streptomyces sp. NPDC005811 TaxID=3154565 RepID=UPI0033FE4E1E
MAALAATGLTSVAEAASKGGEQVGGKAYRPLAHLPQAYKQENLVSDSPTTATAKSYDPNLRSAWGIAQSSDGPWWVNSQHSGVATVYSGRGAIQPPVVKVPIAKPAKRFTGPTGIVFNPSRGFVLSNGKPATFMMGTLDGLIVGWNKDLHHGNAEVIFNNRATSIYEGIALAPATVNGKPGMYLYAPDFKAFRVDVFDEKFRHARHIEKAINSFRRPTGYAPFNITTVGATIYVTYAKPDPALDNALPVVEDGAGLVVAFSPEGKLLQVLQRSRFLNGPYGVTLAPGNFGLYSHHLLVGNNGDGKINVYHPLTGAFVDQIRDASNQPIAISGLWGMFFGNDTAIGGSATSLFFAASAGADFTHGLFGTLTPVQNKFGSGL